MYVEKKRMYTTVCCTKIYQTDLIARKKNIRPEAVIPSMWLDLNKGASNHEARNHSIFVKQRHTDAACCC